MTKISNICIKFHDKLDYIYIMKLYDLPQAIYCSITEFLHG